MPFHVKIQINYRDQVIVKALHVRSLHFKDLNLNLQLNNLIS